ncbi:MAG: TniQ family protein [Aquabacterium sp.]|uniref:TniQ family protein n=1 Tax=Aquabacterium sp. TaxID=1872578 RepID=UPI00345B6D8D|nr:TniQ family protein [Aquabacterium sp.]
MTHDNRPPTQKMVRVPSPQFMEAPSSWLSRIALMQGASLRELLYHLSLPTSGDLDFKMAKLGMAHLQSKLGDTIAAMAAPLHVLQNLRRIDPHGDQLILNAQGIGQFSYCTLCLREQHTPYIPIHWRISTWRYCPLHMCLMETGCPHCGARSALPVSLLHAGPKGNGVAFLRNCTRCDKPLWDRKVLYLKEHGRWFISEFERYQFKNGRAALATLYSGKFFIQDSKFNHGLKGLLNFHRRGLLPSSRPWMQSHVFEQRMTRQPNKASWAAGASPP